jgi:hypothetical protein
LSCMTNPLLKRDFSGLGFSITGPAYFYVSTLSFSM